MSAALDPLFNGAYSDVGSSDDDSSNAEVRNRQAPIIVVSNRLPFVLKRRTDDGGLFRKARSDRISEFSQNTQTSPWGIRLATTFC